MSVLLILLLSLPVCAADYKAPAGDRSAIPRPGAISVLPGGRELEPHGRQFATGPGPFGIAISPKGRRIVTANGGPETFSVTLLERDDRARFRVDNIVAPKDGSELGKEMTWRSVFMGIEFADEDEIFVSEGDEGRVRRMKVDGNGKAEELYALDTGSSRDSYSGDLAYDPVRRLLYVVDQANFRIVVIDEKKRQVVASVAVGRLPFALDLSPDGKRLYVTHVGVFAYSAIPGADEGRATETGLLFPAFGFPSEDAQTGVRRETAEGEVEVPGLGEWNTPESNSVWALDVEDPVQPKVLAKIPTGEPISERQPGGSSPSGVLATQDQIYVSNAHSDSITMIDAASLQVVGEIELRIPGLDSLRGILPAGMDYDPATGWLFVAEAGINAVAVVDTGRRRVVGHIPAAWYPVAVELFENSVYVVNALGHGTGATANKMIAIRERIGRAPGGAVTVFPIPPAQELDQLTDRVMETNGFVPLRRAEPAGYPEAVKHVMLIVKESRSYDEVLGDIGQVGVHKADGAPMLARFGRFGSTRSSGGGFSSRFALKNLNITPNHHAIAGRWALSDNFHSDANTSIEGHHWLQGTPPNPWTVSSLMASYGGRKEFRLNSTAPGRRSFPETRASVHPEEIPERGTIWHHLERNGIPFRNFGEGIELAGVFIGENTAPTGARMMTNVPMPEVLYRNTSRSYPGYNTDIPDQYRASQFIQEVQNRYVNTGKDLPQFLYVHLPNDETAPARPHDGYPYSASFVADNDYALGRIVEYLSGTPYWGQMVVFIVEDEGHGGVDHVSSNRVPFLAAGPWVSFPGLQKTIYRLLGIPPLHLLDAAGTDLHDLFTEEPDFTPYEVQSPPVELFDPETAQAATRQ
jgi:YVTN family beta-propeller protein